MGRYVGLVGTAVLAASAYLAGALPAGDPAPALRAEGQASARVWIGLGLWLLGGVILTAAWWRTKTASLVTAVIWAAPLLLAPPLASRDVYAYACQGAVWLDGKDVYATGVADGGCVWTASVTDLWWHTPTPYGPLAVVLNGAAVAIARALSDGTGTRLIIAITVLRLFAIGGLALIVWGMAQLPGSVRWLGLITPLVAIHAVSGAHNDAVVAGLIVAGLAAAYRKEWLVAGVVVAGAVAIKVTAIVALPFVLLLLPTWRARWSALAAGTAAFAGITLAAGLDLGWVKGLTSTGDLQQWTSLPTGAGMAVGYVLRGLGHPGAMSASITVARAIGLIVLIAIGLYAIRRAWGASPTTIVAACGWILAATALLGPIFYPWYALTALAVLACTTAAGTRADYRSAAAIARARAVVIVVLTFLILPNGLGVAALTKGPGAFLALAIVIAAAVWGVRELRTRSTAPV
jgi:alpha-1,6-mannosyltransferase